MMRGPFDLAKVHRSHEWLKGQTFKALTEVSLETADTALRLVNQRAGVTFTPRSGDLQKATKAEVRVLRNKGHVIRLSNRKAYAAAIDKGARPRVIAARRAPFLRFYWAARGVWVTTKKVNHPGNKPYRFLFNAATRAGERLVLSLTGRMRDIARRF
jgi:hypothetical protein